MSPAYGWLALALGVIGFVVGYDVWAKLGGHHTLSRQMHDWLFNPAVAQFIIPGAAAIVIWMIVHFVTYHSQP